MRIHFIILILCLFGCKIDKPGADQNPSTKKTAIESIVQKGEHLIIRSNKNPIQLSFKDSLLIYDLSPDSTSIIVNSRPLSNLQISEYYQLAQLGKKDSLIETNLSTIVWDSISRKYNIDKNEILFPKTNAKYLSASKVNVEVAGQTEMGMEINETIEVELNGKHGVIEN